MKTLLLLTLSAALHAAPITFTTGGPITPTSEGYFFNLQGDGVATLTSGVPLSSISFFLDTGPNQPGNGVNLALDGVLVLRTTPWVLTQEWFSLSTGVPFTVIKMWTNGGQERGTIMFKEEPESKVPEPGTWALVGLGLVLVLGLVGMRQW